MRDADDRTVPPPPRQSHWCRCPLCGGPAMILATVHCATAAKDEAAACRNYDPGAVEEIEAHRREVSWQARGVREPGW